MTSCVQLRDAFGAGHGLSRTTVGTAIRTLSISVGGVAPGARNAGLNAPVVASSRFDVGIVASMISPMSVSGTTDVSAPYFVNSSATVPPQLLPAHAPKGVIDRTLIPLLRFVSA